MNDDITDWDQTFPAVAMNGFGNFVIAWTDYRLINYDIYAQRFSSLGYPIGSNFRVNDDSIPVLQWAASDDRGNFVITWADRRNGNWDVYAQKYDSSGTPLDTNYLVSDLDYVSFAQEFPRVAANRSNIYFTWVMIEEVESGTFMPKWLKRTGHPFGGTLTEMAQSISLTLSI